MPTLLADPRSAVLDIPVSVETASIISRISSLLEIHSLDFSVLPVLRNVQRCLEYTIKAWPSAHDATAEVCRNLRSAIVELTARQLPTPGVAAGFIPPNRPALRVLSTFPERAPDHLVRTVGHLLIMSLLTDLPLPKQKFETINSLCRAIAYEPSLTEEQTRSLASLLNRSSADLAEVLNQYAQTQDKSALRFNSQLINHLRSGMSSAHPTLQRDADLRRFLSPTALADTVSILVNETTKGETDALISLLGFSLSLHWDLLCQVSLRCDDQSQGHILWLNVIQGVAHLDLRSLLRDLGQPIPGCEVISGTLRLPLPRFVADQLRLAWAMRPSARHIGDLADRHARSSSTIDEANSTSRKGKLLRAAASSAIRLTDNRAVAAYGFLAFHLLDKSDVPYISVSEEQIWNLRAQVFEASGLGESVMVEAAPASHVGSARTAREETVRAVFTGLDLALATAKVGRNCSLESLIEFHNRYACRVGMFLHFVSGARASEMSEFLASAWLENAPFGYLDDKCAGIGQGHTPIPISSSARMQLKLWRRHITSLRDRLSKKLGPDANAAHSLINAIAAQEAVPLLFLLDDHGAPQPLRTEHLFIGQGAKLNRDWGRHLMASRLTAHDRPLSDVQLFLRHQGSGINPQGAGGIELLGDRLLATSLAIESILLNLDIRPMPGLAGAAS